MTVKSLVFACCPSVLRPTLDRIENSPLGYRLAKRVFWSTPEPLLCLAPTFGGMKFWQNAPKAEVPQADVNEGEVR